MTNTCTLQQPISSRNNPGVSIKQCLVREFSKLGVGSEQSQLRSIKQAKNAITTEVVAVWVWDISEQEGEKGNKFPPSLVQNAA